MLRCRNRAPQIVVVRFQGTSKTTYVGKRLMRPCPRNWNVVAHFKVLPSLLLRLGMPAVVRARRTFATNRRDYPRHLMQQLGRFVQ